MKAFQFYDTTINDHVENAFQALSLDEQRAAFSPALWEKPRNSITVRSCLTIPILDQNTDSMSLP